MNNSQLPPPDIVLEDGAVLLLNKPGGLLTQGPPGIDSLELRMKQFLKVRDEKPGKVYLGVPHRLDRPVSGAIVVVKNVRAARRISEQLRSRTVTKTYWAMLDGTIETKSGTWTDWMRKIPDEAKSEIVTEDHPDAKNAILHFEVLKSANNKTLIQIELETGRTHQIRLQCASRNLPIVGDALYDSPSTFGPDTLDLRKRWIGLHARRLAFEHPISKTTVDQTIPLPHHWNCFGDAFDDLIDAAESPSERDSDL
ncbi:MAG: RluA family pseudouridine synthase [Mariniblastus sp.]